MSCSKKPRGRPKKVVVPLPVDEDTVVVPKRSKYSFAKPSTSKQSTTQPPATTSKASTSLQSLSGQLAAATPKKSASSQSAQADTPTSSASSANDDPEHEPIGKSDLVGKYLSTLKVDRV